MMATDCDQSASTTMLQEEPIKVTVYSSDDGQYYMKYNGHDAEYELPKNKKKSNSSKSIEKPTTETLYEIDLYCEVCGHDYKSLMSLNRHLRTRKHLNQMAKMKMNEESSVEELKWNDCNNYFMHADVYDSIVQALWNGNANDNVMETSMNVAECSTPSETLEDNSQNVSISDGVSHGTTRFADEKQTMQDISEHEHSLLNSYKCLICDKLFATAQLLMEHTQAMQGKCGTIVDDYADDFDIESVLREIAESLS